MAALKKYNVINIPKRDIESKLITYKIPDKQRERRTDLGTKIQRINLFPYSDSIEEYNVQTIPKRDIESKLINKIPDKERQREGFNINSKNKFVFISTEKKCIVP